MEGEKSIVRSPLGFEREHNGIMLYRIWATAAECYMGKALATHACTYMPTRARSVHACSDRTTDERYSIAVCRICSLCRDHILVLIRAPDKIALCYRGSCLRDPRENHRCAFTYSLPRILLFPSPFVSALSANPLVKRRWTEEVHFRGKSRICKSDYIASG